LLFGLTALLYTLLKIEGLMRNCNPLSSIRTYSNILILEGVK
jgi:hypothetical protein